MEVLHYTLLSKGAVVSETDLKEANKNVFTYLLVDEEFQNLHMYSNHQKKDCLDKRDTGISLNLDACIVRRLLKK